MPTPPGVAPLTALLTGASSGIGRATGLELAGRGAQLVLMSRDRTSLGEAAVEMRAAGAKEVVVCAGDVTGFYEGPIVTQVALADTAALTPGAVEHLLATIDFPATAGDTHTNKISDLAFRFTAVQRAGTAG